MDDDDDHNEGLRLEHLALTQALQNQVSESEREDIEYNAYVIRYSTLGVSFVLFVMSAIMFYH